VKKLIFIKLLIIVNILIADDYFKPSFDCQNIKGYVENSICNNEKLGHLDNIVSELYKQLIELSSNNNLKQNQKQWLLKRNNCQTISCIEESYINRENYLGELLIKERKTWDYYLFYKNKPFRKEKRIKEFKEELNSNLESYENYVEKFYEKESDDYKNYVKLKEYDLKHCNVFWSTIAGKINFGYASICVAEKKEKKVNIFACYNMAGVFGIKETDNKSEFELIKFLEANCWGG
jgi:uncharacterized protein YecT (DUF1311 family)/peroxiredoxin family protein